MEVVTADRLLGRRLDRLRSVSRPTGRPPPSLRPDHSGALAELVGGRAERRIVVVETAVDLPINTLAMASLPYAVDVRRPFVCLDLETTGLATAAGTLAFLAGMGTWQGDRLIVRQFLLPDHPDEGSLLDLLDAHLPPDAWLVTYNGRTFDWPLLVARYRMHRRGPPPTAGHLDLLPVARQLWKHRLGGARLALVEQGVCAVERPEDLPGALIPERYFAYLRTRRGDLMRAVVEHNRQDIVSLGRLLAVLASDVAEPGRWSRLHPGDLAGLARAYSRRRRPTDALRCVEAALACDAWTTGLPAGAPLHRRLSAERARLLAQVGRRAEAQEAWLAIARRGGPGAATAWLHVARHREHRERDTAGALEACREASAVAERARAWGSPLFAVERDLANRLPRLRRRMFTLRRFSGGFHRAA